MGLYLCVFANDEELDGVEVGAYSDFDWFRSHIVNALENGRNGSRFPILNTHSDCDGSWSKEECAGLKKELEIIGHELLNFPSVPFNSEWQIRVAKLVGVNPRNALECFIDIDGENLIERISALADVAIESGESILFQ